MGFLKDIKLKQPGPADVKAQADDKADAFSGKAPAVSTRQVDATKLGQRLVREAQKKGDPGAVGDAIIAAPAEANILEVMNPPSGETSLPNQPVAGPDLLAEAEGLIRDVELLRGSASKPGQERPSSGYAPVADAELIDSTPSPISIKAEQAALPPKGEYSLNELLAMDPADLVRLALVECQTRGINGEDALLDDKNMRIFVKALNHHSIPYEDIFNMQAVSSPAPAEPDSRPKTRIDSPGGKVKGVQDNEIPVSIRPLGNDDADPLAGTMLQPSDKLLQPDPASLDKKAKKPGPPPLPKIAPKAPEAQPLDVLGIHAAIDRIEKDGNLNASQKVDAADRHFQENKGIQDFMARYGEEFLPLVKRAVAKLRSGQAPDGDERIALDINELLNYSRKKEEQAGVYSGVRRDINDKQDQRPQSAPMPFSLDTNPKQKGPESTSAAGAVTVPAQKQKGAFMRFMTSPTTLSTVGAAAFGGVLYQFGGFEELTLGFNKLFRTDAARETLMVAYASFTSLSILVTELFRRFKVDGKAARYENVEKLPNDVKAMYTQVVEKLSLIARTYAKREDQTKALTEALKEEDFFNSIDELLRLHRGEPMVAAIDASGLNPKVPVLEAIRMAERKIMKEKFETFVDYLNDKEPRHARFKSMYVLDTVFKKECDKLLATDGSDRFLNYPTLVAICSLVKGKSGEKITEQLIEALKNDYSNVDSRFAK